MGGGYAFLWISDQIKIIGYPGVTLGCMDDCRVVRRVRINILVGIWRLSDAARKLGRHNSFVEKLSYWMSPELIIATWNRMGEYA